MEVYHHYEVIPDPEYLEKTCLLKLTPRSVLNPSYFQLEISLLSFAFYSASLLMYLSRAVTYLCRFFRAIVQKRRCFLSCGIRISELISIFLTCIKSK